MTTNRADGEQVPSKRALARALGLSPSAVLKLEARGMPVRSVEAARAWRVANLDPVRIKGSEARAERHGRVDALMQARLEREQTEVALARLRLAEQCGELVRADGVRAALAASCTSARDLLLNMAHRLAPVAAAETDAERVRALIEAEVHRVLETLAGERMEHRPSDDASGGVNPT